MRRAAVHPSTMTALTSMLATLQTDINDKPPDPSQAPSDARLQPRPKVGRLPWQPIS